MANLQMPGMPALDATELGVYMYIYCTFHAKPRLYENQPTALSSTALVSRHTIATLTVALLFLKSAFGHAPNFKQHNKGCPLQSLGFRS